MYEGRVASLFLDSPNIWDRTFRRIGANEPTYVVEYMHEEYAGYGGTIQKRHQRRYKEFRNACRRLSYVITKYAPGKAFILNLPVDVALWIKIGVTEHAICSDCGGHNWKLGKENIDARRGN